MLRSSVAVLAGLVVTMALVWIATIVLTASLEFPADGSPGSTYLSLNLLASAVAGIAGGATAMKLAPHTPHGHVLALAGVLVLLSLPTILAAPAPNQPVWYGLVIGIVGPISVLAGGFLGVRLRNDSSSLFVGHFAGMTHTRVRSPDRTVPITTVEDDREASHSSDGTCLGVDRCGRVRRFAHPDRRRQGRSARRSLDRAV